MICVVNRNYDPKAGLYNGTRVQITQILRNLIKVKILAGNTAGQEVFIGRMKFEYGKLKTEPGIPFTRTQYPLEPGFAMTINKAQGQTLERVCVDLTARQCFSHGMFYTAVSQVRSANSLRIMSGLRDKAVNIVDPEMIRGADAHLNIGNPVPPSDPSPRPGAGSHPPFLSNSDEVPMDTTSTPHGPDDDNTTIPANVAESMEIDNHIHTEPDLTAEGTSEETTASQSPTNDRDNGRGFYSRL